MGLIAQELLRQLGIVGDVSEAYDYTKHGDMDSLGLVRFVLELEGHYHIRFTDADLDAPEFHTIGGLAAVIHHRLEIANQADFGTGEIE